MALQTKCAIKIILLTGVRTAELRLATFDEFNFEQSLWTISAEHSKTGSVMKIHLSLQVKALSRAIKRIEVRITSLVSFLLLTSILVMIFVPETRLFLLIAVFSCAHGFMTVFSNLTKSVLIAGTEKHQIATVISLSNVLGRLFSTIILFCVPY